MELDFLGRYTITAVAAGLIAFVGTPLTLVVARRLGFIDAPGPRKVHLAPVPVLGGVAIWAALVVSLVIFGRGREFNELIAIVIGGTLISLVGLVDDRYGLGPRGKLTGQGAAALVLVFGGVQTHVTNMLWLDVLITVLWVVGIVNALNLMDNMDGLAAGVAAVASGSFLLLAALNGQILVASLAAALLGACLGFLFYNFQPAITFMGDTGSMLLGFALAVLGIKLAFPSLPLTQSWMVPILVLGLPMFDTTLVLISRRRRGVPWYQGGTDHTSHRLTRLGLSQRRVVIALYAVSAGLGLVAVLVTMAPTAQLAWTVTGGVALLALALLYVMEQLLAQPEQTHLKPDIRIVIVVGGSGVVPVVEAAASMSNDITLVLTPVSANAPGLRAMGVDRFNELVLALAGKPGAVREFARPDVWLPRASLAQRAALANGAFRLRGKFLVNGVALATDEVLAALQAADLLIVAGDLAENALPTLLLPEIGRALRRTRRARVLVHADPRAALAELHEHGLDDLFTHAVAGDDVRGPWRTVSDLRDSQQIARAMHAIWAERTRHRGAFPLLAGAVRG